MTSKVKRLYDLEIDEISLVDRPANQHGMVAIAKRAEAPKMSLVDEDGYDVTPEELEVGEYAFDSETGQRFVMATPEEAAELGYEVDDDASELDEYEDDTEYEDDRELATVGKRRTVSKLGSTAPAGLGPRGRKAYIAGRSALRGRGAKVAAGTGAGFVAGRASKSLGQEVLESLSKALDDGDRDEVISKLGDIVADAQADAAAAWQVAKSLADRRELDDYARLAETYELPVDPEQFGGILMRVSKALPEADLQILDRVLSASGVGFEALGYDGPGESDVLSQVYAMANEAVGKSDSGITVEQATTALFEANPDAYDAYCAETR